MCHHAALCSDLLYAGSEGLALKTGQPSLLTLPPCVCPSLCPQVPREHWWDSAQCYQSLSLKGIIVLSCGGSVNQWDFLFPLRLVGREAPTRNDVSWLRPAERGFSRSYSCVSCAFLEKVAKGTAVCHISSQKPGVIQTDKEQETVLSQSCHTPSHQRFPMPLFLSLSLRLCERLCLLSSVTCALPFALYIWPCVFLHILASMRTLAFQKSVCRIFPPADIAHLSCQIKKKKIPCLTMYN